MQKETTILNFFEGSILRNFLELIQEHKKTATGEKFRKNLDKVIACEEITKQEKKNFEKIKMVVERLPDRLIEEALEKYGKE